MFKEQQDTGSWWNFEGNVSWAWNAPNAIRVILWQLLLGCRRVFWFCQHNCCEYFFLILLSPPPFLAAPAFYHGNPWEPTNIMKNQNIKKPCQQWLGQNSRIISNGTVCLKHIGIISLWKITTKFDRWSSVTTIFFSFFLWHCCRLHFFRPWSFKWCRVWCSW